MIYDFYIGGGYNWSAYCTFFGILHIFQPYRWREHLVARHYLPASFLVETFRSVAAPIRNRVGVPLQRGT
jgi:hypothetical protein